MKVGKQSLHELPVPDISTIGAYADELERAARARGETLPPALRLQVGEPDFRTPLHIREAAIKSLTDEAQTYGPAAGWPWLRELLAAKVQRVNHYSVDSANVLISMGGTGGIFATLLATVGPGDEVLLPDPAWPFYDIQISVTGARAVRYPLDPQHGWLPDLDTLEQLVTPRTRLLIINSPANPTGAVYSRQLLADLLAFAQKHDLYLLADECYDQMLFEGEHVSPAAFLTRSEFESGRVISTYSFSKTYAMTGWRIGYLVTGQKLLKTILDVVNVNMTNISTQVQRGAAAALLGPQDCVGEMCAAYQGRRDLVVALLKDYGRYVYTPGGAFYALINIDHRDGRPRLSRDFSFDLVRAHNLTVSPGNGFGAVSENYVRISLAASEEDLERGVRLICEFADQDH